STNRGEFTFLDLFAGAGGFTLGLVRVGGRSSSLAIDADGDCAETLNANFPSARVVNADAASVGYDAGVDVVVAGPPCQGFSTLNRNRSGDPRNLLYVEILRCVDSVGPQIVVVENVPRFLGSEKCTALAGA